MAELNGIVIAMYAADHNPPHVHVYYAEHDCVLAIASGDVLTGFVPARQLRQANAWVAEHRDELLDRWATFNP